jgi:hypothetical protein
MAFVEISRGKEKRVVSMSSYKNFFKSAGWKLAGEIPATSQSIEKVEKKKETKKEEKVEEPVKDEWDEVLSDEEVEDDDEAEKPISEMTKKEMQEYAEKKGISLAGLSTASQYRQAIQNYMKEV